VSVETYAFRQTVEIALREDLGSGDLTSANIFPPGHRSRAEFLGKEEAVLCGLPVAAEVFAQLSPEIAFTAFCRDGQRISPGTVVAEVCGPTHLLLSGERTALNFLQRLSGIATLTASYAAEVAGFAVKIVDTRKTTPGLRVLEKYAVRCGGGSNHRLGLFDAVMIKDNHIKAAGGILQAVAQVRRGVPFLTPVEVETTDIRQVEEALAAGADVVMLDNMQLSEMAEAVSYINGRALVEASGGITLSRLREIAATGVDVISVGALTHSAAAVDISMKVR